MCCQPEKLQGNEIFLLRKNDDNNFVLQLVDSRWENKGQINMKSENDKKNFVKKEFQEIILYIVKIKVRLNLIR